MRMTCYYCGDVFKRKKRYRRKNLPNSGNYKTYCGNPCYNAITRIKIVAQNTSRYWL